MKKMQSGSKLPYISLFFVCMCVLICTFLYGKDKTDSDTEQDDILVANEVTGRETESLKDVEMGSEIILEDADMESDDMEEEIETESEEITAEMVCERLRSIDFTIKEYPIDEEIYTEEMDREYKEVFLQVLFNQIPIQFEDGEELYFNEIDSRDKESNEEDYTKTIKQYMNYYYLDFDGDGFPELIVAPSIQNVRFGGPRVFKYDRDSKKVYVDDYRFMKYRLLCSGKFFCEDSSGISAIRYGYQEIDSQGNVVAEVEFQLVHPAYEYPERYFIDSVDDKYLDVEIDKESWDEIFHDFFEAMDNAVTGITFDELFSDIEHP